VHILPRRSCLFECFCYSFEQINDDEHVRHFLHHHVVTIPRCSSSRVWMIRVTVSDNFAPTAESSLEMRDDTMKCPTINTAMPVSHDFLTLSFKTVLLKCSFFTSETVFTPSHLEKLSVLCWSTLAGTPVPRVL